jgi:hypothetical protein
MNSIEMPQQPQLAQSAGLSAMLQAKGSATGVGKQSMDKMMALADKLPDSELADVLSGKSVRVPQFAAMLAAMGRESLRTAVAGAQAGQEKKPSKKDQMLARMQPQPAAGLDVIPTQNMEPVSAAEGGIIGYSGEDGSVVSDPNSSAFSQDVASTRARVALENQRRKLILQHTTTAGPFGYFTSSPHQRRDAQATIDFLKTATPQQLREFEQTNTLPAQTRGGTEDPAGAVALNAPPEGTPSANTPPANTPPAGNRPPGIAPPAAEKFEAPPARKSPIDQLLAPTEDVAKQVASGKEQAQGEFLMQMGASLLGNPNLGRALQQGIERGLPGLAANRKEANALLKDQREYGLSLSKAQEAAAQGRDDLAFKYADLAEKAQYHAGVIGVGMARSSGAGGNLTAKQYDSARKAADTALENELKRLGPRSRLMTPEQRDAFRTEAFNRTLQTIQSGVMPQAPGIPTYGAPPQGAVTRE